MHASPTAELDGGMSRPLRNEEVALMTKEETQVKIIAALHSAALHCHPQLRLDTSA
jgi:hypothetical protein